MSSENVQEAVTFNSLNLNPEILKAVASCGYTEPTPVQGLAIPVAMTGRDLIASAQTGTGKTAAFVLPALERLTAPPAIRGKGPRVLVLTPTRELANQVSDAVRTYGRFLRIKSGAILGGMPYREQLRLLSAPVDFIVATPGRLIDHLQSGRLSLARTELLILDEADRMLDMGFIEDVEKIAAATPAGRQTLLFSATIDHRIATLSARLLRDPETIRISPKQVTHDHIEQRLMVVDDLRHKNRLLKTLVRDVDLDRAIIFSATKRDAEVIAASLAEEGHAVRALHGDMSQGARNRVMVEMRRGRVRLLVATDVAARGLDVSGISHVINFDLPKFAEDYVHRIGRTGRAGASGIAISFASPAEAVHLDRIQRYTGKPLPMHVVPGMEPTVTLRSQREKKGSGRPYQGKGGRPAGAPRSGGYRRGGDQPLPQVIHRRKP